MRLGKFITFEGGEGTGKSTQARHLQERLAGAGRAVTLTREPGGSPYAEDIREILLNPKHHDRSSLSEALLFYAARDDHLRQTITPALKNGGWVISDRFSDSTRAYQGAAGGVPTKILKTLEHWVVGIHKPDLTIILDMAPEAGLKRAAERRADAEIDRFENLDLEFHKRLRQGFIDIAKNEPDRCQIVDADRAIDLVARDIWDICRERLVNDK